MTHPMNPLQSPRAVTPSVPPLTVPALHAEAIAARMEATAMSSARRLNPTAPGTVGRSAALKIERAPEEAAAFARRMAEQDMPPAGCRTPRMMADPELMTLTGLPLHG